MSNTNQSSHESGEKDYTKHITVLSIASVVLFFTGLYCLIYFFYDYYSLLNPNKFSHYFNSKDDTGTLGSIIAGTTGVLWTFAGVTLFAASLLQTKIEINLQRKDMKQQLQTIEEQKNEIKQQRELFQSQQNENTLIFILNNYTRTIKSIEYFDIHGEKIFGEASLNQVSENIIHNFNSYMEVFNKEFSTNWLDVERQYDIYFYRNKRELEIVNIVFENFKFIYEFVTKNLASNGNFYLELVWNSYSNSEKFIIGMELANNFNSYEFNNYDYRQYYYSMTNYQKTLHQLPIFISTYNSTILINNTLDFSTLSDKLFLNYNDIKPFAIDQINFEYQILVNQNYLNGFISIKNCSINYKIKIDSKSEEFLKIHNINEANIKKVNDGDKIQYSVNINEFIHVLLERFFNDINKTHNNIINGQANILESNISIIFIVKSKTPDSQIKQIKYINKAKFEFEYYLKKLRIRFSYS